jgi:hypothetical protein
MLTGLRGTRRLTRQSIRAQDMWIVHQHKRRVADPVAGSINGRSDSGLMPQVSNDVAASDKLMSIKAPLPERPTCSNAA